MPVLASVQLNEFFICILSGFMLGILYDFFSALRLNFPILKITVSVLDTFFWIIFAIIFFISLQLFCNGEFYWFFIVGAVMGFVLYLFSLSRVFVPILRKIIRVISGIFKKLYRVIHKILVLILRFFSPIFGLIRKIVQFVLKKSMIFVKKNVEIIQRFSVLLKKV